MFIREIRGSMSLLLTHFDRNFQFFFNVALATHHHQLYRAVWQRAAYSHQKLIFGADRNTVKLDQQYRRL